MMAERKHKEGSGIKLFGATIMLQMNKKDEALLKEEEEESSHEELLSDNQKKPPEKIIPCPRCKSMDTKFCYFNNYNVNQPRHFCKGCQRYWTAGGALRNVPVGAGRRKTKPPCRTFSGLPENCVFDSSGMVPAVQPFELEGMVEDWHVVTTGDGGFRQILPGKRRRDCLDGQTCWLFSFFFFLGVKIKNWFLCWLREKTAKLRTCSFDYGVSFVQINTDFVGKKFIYVYLIIIWKWSTPIEYQ